jgi:ribonuclease P/MRP protein subunit POP1
MKELKRKDGSATLKERKKVKQEMKVDSIKMGLLPRSLNVLEAFNARKFEINSMESALKNEGQFTGAVRVFQQVKRHMRRRTASVNVKRLPKTFRQRAINQMLKDPTPPKLSRKARRKPKRLLANILKTKGSSKWLETHIWHAKRMKMIDRWGMRLALHPNQKGIRFAYKSVKHESMIHDKSYQKIIEITGEDEVIGNALKEIADPTVMSFTAGAYLSGKKQGLMMLHEKGKFPFKTVARVSFLWKPEQEKDRTLWIWVNNDSYKKVFTLLVNTINGNNKEVELKPVKIGNTRITPLFQDLIRFEFSGPRSHAILSTCLTLSPKNSDSHKLWTKYLNMNSPTCFPPSVVIGLEIEDPRICFPKLMKKRQEQDPIVENLDELQIWPDGVQKSDIWSQQIRQKCLNERKSNSEINILRSKNMIPGTPLIPDIKDIKIPVLLIKRDTLGQHSSRDYSEQLSGWDLIAPKGFAMSLWNLFFYAGIRVGGLLETHHSYYECGLPSYPVDYPESESFLKLVEEQSRLDFSKYKRTPKSKRVNYLKKGVKYPFRQPFETLSDSIDVIHSERMVSILVGCLEIKFDSFEVFLKEFQGRVNRLIEKRGVVVGALGGLFCRVKLELKSGLVAPNSKIHLRDDKVEVLVYSC